jgi:hypothetical protein
VAKPKVNQARAIFMDARSRTMDHEDRWGNLRADAGVAKIRGQTLPRRSSHPPGRREGLTASVLVWAPFPLRSLVA